MCGSVFIPVFIMRKQGAESYVTRALPVVSRRLGAHAALRQLGRRSSANRPAPSKSRRSIGKPYCASAIEPPCNIVVTGGAADRLSEGFADSRIPYDDDRRQSAIVRKAAPPRSGRLHRTAWSSPGIGDRDGSAGRSRHRAIYTLSRRSE